MKEYQESPYKKFPFPPIEIFPRVNVNWKRLYYPDMRFKEHFVSFSKYIIRKISSSKIYI